MRKLTISDNVLNELQNRPVVDRTAQLLAKGIITEQEATELTEKGQKG